MTESPLQIELRRRMEAAGYNQKSLARVAGLNETAVRDILKGRSKNPRADTLEALGQILGCTIDALRGGGGTAITDMRKINVVGKVQAGEWVEALEWPHSDWYAIAAPADDRFGSVTRFGLEVFGPSMNQFYAEKDVIICVRFDDIGRTAQSGERVVVQRTNAQGAIEATVKEVVVDEQSRVWLWPRSTHPEYQQPYLLRPRGMGSDLSEGHAPNEPHSQAREVYADEFEVVALVIGSYRRE